MRRAGYPSQPIRNSVVHAEFYIGRWGPSPLPYRQLQTPRLQLPMALMLSNNRMIAGVCGGLAEWLGWDPTLVRILYSILTVFTAFSGLIVYLLLWIIMPRKSA